MFVCESVAGVANRFRMLRMASRRLCQFRFVFGFALYDDDDDDDER